jgi:hypothetical protein
MAVTRNYDWTNTGRTNTASRGHVGASEANYGTAQGYDSASEANSSGYVGYASAIQAATSVLSGIAETQAFKAKLEAETNAAIQNVGNAVTSFELQQVKNKEQIDNINHILGDKLSERGLIAMKEEALLRTASAETGTSGGTTAMAVKEAFINENMDKANLISAARQQMKSVYSSMDMNLVGIQNSIDSQLLGGTAVTTNPLISGIAGGLNVATNTLSMIPMSARVEAFGIKPTRN